MLHFSRSVARKSSAIVRFIAAQEGNLVQLAKRPSDERRTRLISLSQSTDRINITSPNFEVDMSRQHKSLRQSIKVSKYSKLILKRFFSRNKLRGKEQLKIQRLLILRLIIFLKFIRRNRRNL